MIDQLVTSLQTARPVTVSGPRANSAALLAAWTGAAANLPVVSIVPTERQAELFEQDLNLFTDAAIIRYPGYDVPPYTPLSPDPETVAARLATLYRLLTGEQRFIVVASAEALLRRVLPKNGLANIAELVMAGEETDRQELVRRLVAAGYETVSLVQRVGDFSVRGSILDVFPPGFAAPLRLDFFGDTVESLRSFDPITQRSIAPLSEAVFLPASDILYPDPHDASGMAHLARRFIEQAMAHKWETAKFHRLREQVHARLHFPGVEFYLPLFYSSLSVVMDYFPANGLVFMVDPHEIGRTIRLAWERILANYNEMRSGAGPALGPEMLFVSEEEFHGALAPFRLVRLEEFPITGKAADRTFACNTGNHKLIKQEIDLQRKKQGLLAPLIHYIATWLDEGGRVVFACRSTRHSRHLAELLSQHELTVALRQAPLTQEALATLPPRTVVLFEQPLSAGFDMEDLNLHLVSESELYGVRSLAAAGRFSRKRESAGEAVRFDELRAGDIVVHREHGIGVYEGLVHLELHGAANDFLQISYQGSDKLYVPVDRINFVNKYKGLADKAPKIDRLGSKSWLTAKKKVKEAVWEVAQDLLALYAERQLKPGLAFGQPSELYHELEESFAFDETEGQDKAISEVLADLLSEKPMDRLLCGDVGYGKTEVAIRAAFKVVEEGYQVAVLVPTTVLAEQHGQTFAERLEGFPVRVECLSRFRPPPLQRKILQELAAGRLDVIIGTHRLLSRDVVFKRLGLLIVDEEHRFGVSHKEKIKRLRAEVDVLTLSATPIPRTLQMSLLGVRDLSVISTPPEQRRPIKTFIARYDDLVIKEAVIREMQRKGQIFIVHNRVRSIHSMAQRVQKLVPEARVAVAHGQMPPKNLEEIMVRFVNKELDVLVCTTIIESGLDIANANTIIINRADRLGLAEIYQLRGRVGRSSEQSYAYLLVPSLDTLTKDARDRLRAVMECSDLGGGFRLAMSDLQIRGGGNLLGVSQSGHIAAVGYDLYLELLQKTVADLKRRAAHLAEEAEEVEPEINLRISAYIPEDYIRDINQRYVIYRRISGLAEQAGLLDLQDELQDRYGDLPAEVGNLLAVAAIKMELRKLKISRLEQGKETLVFTFLDQTPVAPQKILELVNKSKNRVRFTPEARLIVQAPMTPAERVFATTRQVLAGLQGRQ